MAFGFSRKVSFETMNWTDAPRLPRLKRTCAGLACAGSAPSLERYLEKSAAESVMRALHTSAASASAGGGRRCAGARGAARARLAQRAAAVLLLHGTVRLQQRTEVDRGAVRAVGVRAVLAISQLELQPEQPG